MELSREDKMIKQLCKTFKEDTDSYWLNTQRYIEEAAKYNFDPRRMQIKMEMLDRGENEKIPSKKTIGRVMDYCRGLVRNDYKDPSIHYHFNHQTSRRSVMWRCLCLSD